MLTMPQMHSVCGQTAGPSPNFAQYRYHRTGCHYTQHVCLQWWKQRASCLVARVHIFQMHNHILDTTQYTSDAEFINYCQSRLISVCLLMAFRRRLQPCFLGCLGVTWHNPTYQMIHMYLVTLIQEEKSFKCHSFSSEYWTHDGVQHEVSWEKGHPFRLPKWHSFHVVGDLHKTEVDLPRKMVPHFQLPSARTATYTSIPSMRPSPHSAFPFFWQLLFWGEPKCHPQKLGVSSDIMAGI